MFVVHTINQLEEAVRVGAEEILVTGGLARNVHEAYLLKSCTDKTTMQLLSSDDSFDIDNLAEKTGLPAWGITSLMLITNDYSLLHSHLDHRPPHMFLHLMVQH